MGFLNKKSLKYKQSGGDATQFQSPSLTQQIAEMLQSGSDPKSVIQQLLSSGVDEIDIKEAFMDLGMAPSDVDALFISDEEAQAELDQALDEAESTGQQESYNQEDYSEGTDSDVSFGIFGNNLFEAQNGTESMFPLTINQYLNSQGKKDGYSRNPMVNYLPMDLGTRGDVFSGALFLGDAMTDLFGGKTNPNTGLKEGFFRDVDVKKARQKAAIPSYYDYKVTTAAGDKNEYVGDKIDLYNAAKKQGSLRTKDQYSKDMLANSRVNFNTETGKYDQLLTSRPVDRSLLGKSQNETLDAFMQNSESLQTLKDRFDPETMKMIQESQKTGMGSLGINEAGQASSYIDAQSNPYLYETMMGINTLQDQPNTRLNFLYQPESPMYKRQVGGEKAQDGTEINPIVLPQEIAGSFRDWVQNQQEKENYLKSLDMSDSDTSVAQPQVEISNKFAGDLNRFMDSRFMKGYGKLSNLAVEGSRFANEMFKNKKAREAEGRLYEMTQADNMFGYYEDPLNKKGTWDVNTGLAEPDNYVPYMKTGGYYQQGGSITEMNYQENFEEIDLDPDTVAKLIAAGANIEIL